MPKGGWLDKTMLVATTAVPSSSGQYGSENVAGTSLAAGTVWRRQVNRVATGQSWAVLAAATTAAAGALSSARAIVFTCNQHTYLAHAASVARSAAILGHDWLIGTRDPTPLFTHLATALLALGDWTIGLTNAVLGVVFILSLASIAASARSAAAHTSGALLAWTIVLSVLWVLLPYNFRTLLFEGVAGQRAYAEYLQPSNCGVFLVFAVWAALRKHPFLAVLAGGVAAALHPTYALSSLLLTLAVFIATAATGRWRCAWAALAFGLASVAPTLILTLREFAPTNSDLAHRASSVLAYERFPWHAVPQNWFDSGSVIRLAIVSCSIAFSPRSSRLFLGTCLVVSVVFTLAVMRGDRPEFLLLFPWRTTVWLVPACSALLLGAVPKVALPSKWLVTPRHLFGLGLVLVFARLGVRAARTDKALGDGVGIALLQQVSAEERQRWVALVPPTWDAVRLNAPAAVYVDLKSHPYRDVEVL